MAASALLEDGVLKPLVHRGRPPATRFPAGERRHTDPSTSAFPSGHVGAAFAFAAATASDAPALRAPLAVIAVTTMYARVSTGRHYLTDAVAGAAVGLAAGLVAQRLGQRSGDDPVDDGPAGLSNRRSTVIAQCSVHADDPM